MLFKRFSPGAVVSSAILALSMAVPAPTGSEELDIGNLMNRMEGAYVEVVKSLLLVPVLELANEAPFAKVQKQLGEIVNTARLLPKIDNYKNDNSFRNFAGNVEKQAQGLAKLTGKKRQVASLSALSRLQDACMQCHKKFRF
jgi:hypothetical protein